MFDKLFEWHPIGQDKILDNLVKNITDKIEKLLDGMLSELHLNYVDEKVKPGNKVEEETKKSDDK